MSTTYTDDRLDDIPFLVEVLRLLKLDEILEAHVGTHGDTRLLMDAANDLLKISWREEMGVNKASNRLVITGVKRNHEAIAAREEALGWRVMVTNAADYDPIRKTLTVQRALIQITTDNIIIKGTKTDRDRVIKLNPSLALEIERHHKCSVFNKPTDWICACADGSHHVPRHFTRYFERLVKNLGIGITLHGLRHSHATALIAAGVPINAVSERLGHSETSTTMNIYVHTSPAMQQQAADETEALWRSA